MFERYVRFVVRHPVWVIAAILGVTVFLVLGAFKIRMVVDPKMILPQDHPYVQLNDRIEKTFGGSRVVVIGIAARNGDVFTPAMLAKIRQVTEAVKQVPGIKEENVVSITDRKVKYVQAIGDRIDVRRLIEELPTTPEEADAVRRRVMSEPLFRNRLISADGRAAAVITDFREWTPGPAVTGAAGADAAATPPEGGATDSAGSGPPDGKSGANYPGPGKSRPQGGSASDGQKWNPQGAAGPWGGRMSDREIRDALAAVVAKVQDAETEVYLGGLPVALAYMEDDSRQFGLLFLAALGVIVGILYLAFRSLQGMFLPLATGILSVIWALGLIGHTGVPMDPFNTMTPILILAIAAGHSIQILKRYYEEVEKSGDNRAAVIATTVKIGPVMLTAGLVAAASFASLVTFHLKTFQAFGLFTAFGIVSAVVLELSFIPAARSLMRAPRPRPRRPLGWIDRWLIVLAHQVTGWRRRPILIGTGLLLALALVGMSRVEVNNSLKSQFFETTRLRMDERALNNHFGGTSTFYVMVEGQRPGELKDPHVLAAIDRLQRSLESVSGVGVTESYVDYLKRMNRTFHAGDPAFERVPEDRDVASNFLFLYAMSGNPADFARLIDYDYQNAVIWTFLKSDSTQLAERLIEQVKRSAAEFPPGIRVEVAGSSPVTVALNDTMVNGKIRNILQVAAIILVASTLVLRSLVGGLLVLIPLSLAVLVNFGVMGLFGVTLGIGTAAISAMAVGMGADYAIYLLFRLREEYAAGRSLEEAIGAALRTSGKAILLVASAIAGGYATLPFSGYYLHMEGILVPLAMVTSSLATLTLLPLIVSFARPRFIVGPTPVESRAATTL